MHHMEALKPLLANDGCIGAVTASVLGKQSKPIRAILFNKSQETIWSLAWHQDRTICVKEKRKVLGFGPSKQMDQLIAALAKRETGK